MKLSLHFLLIAISLFFIPVLKAQTNELVRLTGTVKGKVVTELTVIKKKNGKSERLTDFVKDSASKNFVLNFPFDDSAQYTLVATSMKQGHRRLEKHATASYPFTIKKDQDLAIEINTALLAKGTAFKRLPTAVKMNVVTVSGSLLNWSYGAEIKVSRLMNGIPVLLTTCFLRSGQNAFALALPLKEEGFYIISSSRWQVRIYLKPNDELVLHIDGKTGEHQLVNASPENKLHSEWQKLIAPITKYGYSREMVATDTSGMDEYIATYTKLQPDMLKFKETANTGNNQFDELFQEAMKIDESFVPIRFLYVVTSKRNARAFGSSVRNFKEVPVFYHQFIRGHQFANAKAIGVPELRPFMKMYGMLMEALLTEPQKSTFTRAEKLQLLMDAIKNDTLKAALLHEKLTEIEVNNLTEFRATFEPFKKYAGTGDAKKKYNEVYTQFIGDTVFLGKSAYNFSLPDTSGKMVSMKDFKGKVVFIDVWATWCGPCKEQFPHMKAIEEEYKDNPNIVFVGISIDRKKDQTKWLNMIRKENLVGVQLLDDVGLSFGRKYEVMSIPRFLLIDKQGNWVEIRCPRPSDKEDLKRYLEKALQQTIL